MKKTSLVSCAIVLMMAGQAMAWPLSEVMIEPENPSSSDVIEITLCGSWPDSCVPRASAVRVNGNDIYFDVIDTTPWGVFCLMVISGWLQTQTVGPLGPGTYTVYASLVDCPQGWFGDEHDPINCPPGYDYTPVAEFAVSDHQFILSSESISVPEGDTATFRVVLMMDPSETVEVTVARESGDADITVESGASLIFDSSNYSIGQTVTLAAAQDDDYMNGEALVTISTPRFVRAQLRAVESDNYYVPPVLFVDADAAGANNGRSWVHAYRNLQDALALASYTSVVEEVRVTQGIYRPAEPAGSPGANFQLISGVSIKGGYAGFGEVDPDARDIGKYETILSGDLNGDDGPNFANNGENSYHVVKGSGILDGFTITGGRGGGSGSDGGGLYCTGKTTVTNCTFKANCAAYGAGITCLSRSNLTLDNCVFIGNSAGWYGGGIHCWTAKGLTVRNCVFVGNAAGEGGGLYSFGTNCTLVNCIFTGNRTKGGYRKEGYGGGMYKEVGFPGGQRTTMTNCTFVGNTAVAKGGGGLYDNFYLPNSAVLTNCIFWGNRDSEGTSESAQIYRDNKIPIINYCCIQGWTGDLGGVGNIDGAPRFADAGYWGDSSDIQIAVEPNSPKAVWVDGDYHLLGGSPCIDAGDPNHVAEPNETDLDGNPRVRGNRIDMGAYETETCICLGDMAGPFDQIDLQDLDAMVTMLVEAGPPFIVPCKSVHCWCADIAEPFGQVDLEDLTALVAILQGSPQHIVWCEGWGGV